MERGILKISISLKAKDAMTKGFFAAKNDARTGIVSKGATESLKRKKPKARKVVVRTDVCEFLSSMAIIIPKQMNINDGRRIITETERKTEKISILKLNWPTSRRTNIWKNTTTILVKIRPFMKSRLFT